MKRSMLPFLGLYALALQDNYRDFSEDMEAINTPRKTVKINKCVEQPKPKGVNQYWFRIDGTFIKESDEERMLKSDLFYSCFALNDKNAIRKFNQYRKRHVGQ